jgi:hypothetical protein
MAKPRHAGGQLPIDMGRGVSRLCRRDEHLMEMRENLREVAGQTETSPIPSILGYWLPHGRWDDGRWSKRKISGSSIDHRLIDHA